MSDAQELLKQGIAAIRDNNDISKGRDLIKESIRLDAENDLAWVWLAMTVSNPEKRLKMLERAEGINPNNVEVVELKHELMRRYQLGDAPPPPVADSATSYATGSQQGFSTDDIANNRPIGAPDSVIHAQPPEGAKINESQLNNDERRHITEMMQKANNALSEKALEDVVAYCFEILQIKPDHGNAFPMAVRTLIQLEYHSDAEELAWMALNAGTPEPSIAQVALKLAKQSNDPGHVVEVKRKLITTQAVDEDMVVELCDEAVNSLGPKDAFDFVQAASQRFPENQRILLMLAHLYEFALEEDKAQEIYYRIVNISHRTEEGKYADQKLADAVVPLTDGERGSFLLAFREAVGISFIYIVLAFQDAGFSLALGATRFAGVGLALIGGYILITGSSSPQQKGIAKLLGGEVDPETESDLPKLDGFTRAVLIVAGALSLAIAFYLVFPTAIELLFEPVDPGDIPTLEDLLEETV